MSKYSLIAEIKSPLSICVDRQARTPKSLSFIPGSTLRGTIASVYLRVFGKDDDFDHIFLSGENIFPNLYPTQNKNLPSEFIPSTALSCKRKQGFEKHGVKDSLFLKAVRALTGKAEKLDLCSKCDNELRPFSGFWNRDFSNPAFVEPHKRVLMHTGIDRLTGTVAESILYGIEAIEPTNSLMYMTGKIELTEKAKNKLSKLLHEPSKLLHEPLPFFVGKAKTRGYGEIGLSLEGSQPENIDDKWEELSEKYKKFASNYSESLDIKHGFFFSITLQSDAIVLDQFLRYTNSLETEISIPDIKLVTSVLKPVRIRGWNHAHKLPKEDEWGVEKGSVYFYRYNGKDEKGVISQLKAYEKSGLGIRKEEGFGRISVNNPFHWKFA